MIYAISALRDNQQLLLNTLDIYLREPVLDWTSRWKAKAKGGNYDNILDTNKDSISTNDSTTQVTSSKQSSLPNEELSNMRVSAEPNDTIERIT